MEYIGEIAAVGVAISWATGAMFFEHASKRIGSITVNLLKVIIATILLAVILFAITGSPYPLQVNEKAWWWLIASGVIGFVICDLCLLYAYVTISSRFTQLIMTLYPPVAAFTGWIILKESMPTLGYYGMAITMFGVAISLFKRDAVAKKITLSVPIKGFICAIIGAICQGVGLVLSKQGMIYYAENPEITKEVTEMIPFASTQIRAGVGIIGFFLIMMVSGRLPLLSSAIKDRKGLKQTFFGSIFGPFIGVTLSLIAIQSANTGIVTTIMATTPVVILVPHVLINKKRVSPLEVAGAVISVIGVSLFFV